MGKMIPKSYDVIGDIAILNEKGNKKQAQLLLKKLKNIKVVLKRSGIFKGKHRTRKLSYLAGEKRTETIHKENNALMKLDVEKCYFSQRLSEERKRIFKQVKKGEIILVAFSGIQPYGLVISKNTKAKMIYGIEINPVAHKYAEENVKLNKISNIINYKGDVKKILPKLKIKFDRIIMPLPKSSKLYLNLIKNKIKKNGIIHLYIFLKKEQINKKYVQNLIKNYKILKITKCGAYSPNIYRTCIDLKPLQIK